MDHFDLATTELINHKAEDARRHSVGTQCSDTPNKTRPKHVDVDHISITLYTTEFAKCKIREQNHPKHALYGSYLQQCITTSLAFCKKKVMIN